MFYFHVYIYIHNMHIWCVQRPEEDTGTLELEIEMVVGHHVGAEIWIQVLSKSNKCFY